MGMVQNRATCTLWNQWLHVCSAFAGLQTLEPLSAQLRRSEPAFAQPASSLGAEGLVRFWQEEGLRPKAASLLAEVCLKRGGALADPDNLFSLLQRWRRVLPEADVVSMASKDPDLLQAEVSVSIKNLVRVTWADRPLSLETKDTLCPLPRAASCAPLRFAGGNPCLRHDHRNATPRKSISCHITPPPCCRVHVLSQVALRQALPDLDVIKLAEATPSLLWTDDVATCATRTVDLIRKWSPRSDALIIVETYPELIIRIPKYYANCDFFELPVRRGLASRPEWVMTCVGCIDRRDGNHSICRCVCLVALSVGVG